MPRLAVAPFFGWIVHRTILLLGPLLIAGLLILDIAMFRPWSRNRLRLNDRYIVRFADIECAAPPGQPRDEFLTEVQYLSSLPDKLHVLEVDQALLLADAFARHPRVANVERVQIVPPRTIRVLLTFRPAHKGIMNP